MYTAQGNIVCTKDSESEPVVEMFKSGGSSGGKGGGSKRSTGTKRPPCCSKNPRPRSCIGC